MFVLDLIGVTHPGGVEVELRSRSLYLSGQPDPAHARLGTIWTAVARPQQSRVMVTLPAAELCPQNKRSGVALAPTALTFHGVLAEKNQTDGR